MRKTEQEKGERRGGGARFVGEGPGGKAKEEQRPKDLCSALPGQQSQQQEALPCPGKQRPLHTCKDTVHTHTHRAYQNTLLRQGWDKYIEVQEL